MKKDVSKGCLLYPFFFHWKWNRGIVILYYLNWSSHLWNSRSFRIVVQKKKREKGKNTSVLCIFLRYLSPPLAPLVLARSSHVGTRWINRRGNVPTNVPFIRSDSVLSGRDISRRRDDFVKRGGGRGENGSTSGLIRTNLLARVRLLLDKFGRDCSRCKACGPNILLIKI